MQMEVDFLSEIVRLYEENDWRRILQARAETDDTTARKILWVWPSLSNLKFIENIVLKFNLEGVVSIGCGCGLFEWLLQQSTGLHVSGYEINEEWWKSKYSNPQFIPLEYPELPLKDDFLGPKCALLFCYFNNGAAFREYITSYVGDLVFIIGPGHGSGRHTDPDPFSPDFGDETCWRLLDYQEVNDTKDFIAAYVRNDRSESVCKNLNKA